MATNGAQAAPDSTFLEAWRTLELALRQASTQDDRASIVDVIQDLRDRNCIDHPTYQQLDTIRRLRNLFNHVAANGNGRALFLPTVDMCDRMLEIAGTLRAPRLFRDVAQQAMCASANHSISDVLAVMRSNDYDHIPYTTRNEWFVFGRDQVARFVELLAYSADGPVAIDLSGSVHDLAAAVGVQRPLIVAAETPLLDVVDALDQCARTGHLEGLVPMAICFVKHKPRVLTLSDLPGLFPR